jgi:hypothetical protein
MRYWASSRVSAVGSIPNVVRISSPNLLSNSSTRYDFTRSRGNYQHDTAHDLASVR